MKKEHIEKGQEALKAWREAGSPTKTRQEKFDEKPSPLKAIGLFCISCLGGEDEPGIRTHVRECVSKKCPLYMYRPYK